MKTLACRHIKRGLVKESRTLAVGAEQRDVVCSAKQRAFPSHSLLRTLSKMLPRIWKMSLKKSDATYVTSPPLPMSKEALSSPPAVASQLRRPDQAIDRKRTQSLHDPADPELGSGRQTSLLRRVSRPLRAAVSSRPAYQPPLVPSCRCRARDPATQPQTPNSAPEVLIFFGACVQVVLRALRLATMAA